MKKRMNQLVAMGLAAGMAISPVSALAEEQAGGEKWTSEKTADGWIKVTNEGGATLGYTEESGVSIIEEDGYAFKDLDQDGELDVYEDWRQDYETRAEDLASQLSGEEIAPLLTHGGWYSFGSELGEQDETYFAEGGRAGVTRSAYNEGNTEKAVDWNNMLQAKAEAEGGHGIPVTISADPVHFSGLIDQNALAATMNTELAKDIAIEASKQYRAVGITMLLGPQIDIATQTTWSRTSGAYTEDPALSRDLANAYISGLQSTYAEDGTDEGWGEDSVIAIAKHYVGAGASEGGRNDHYDNGKYTVFPGENFEAHLIPFFDGAFKLDSVTGAAAGLMPNYAISYSEDGSLGEEVGGAYSEYKISLLRDNGYDGFILTDWQITNDDATGHGAAIEEMTEAERFAALFMNGNDQIGGTTNISAAIEGYQLMVEELGQDEADTIMRDHARRFFLTQMETGLYENPYLDTEKSVNAVWTDETKAYGRSTQEQGVIMLKNSDGIIHQADESEEKATVYVPYTFTAASSSFMGTTPASCDPMMDLDIVSQYYNVVTDTVGEPSGEDEEGNPAYTEEDIIRADASELAKCDFALVAMSSPVVDGTVDEDGIYYPASIQYEEYTADTAHEAIAGDVEIVEVSDGYYGVTTQEVDEDRSYTGNTAALPSSYGDYTTLQYVKSVIPESCKVVVLMGMGSTGTMVWSEVEPLADAIIMYHAGGTFDGAAFADEVLLDIVSGKVEPSALLPEQQPASMEAVEAQQEDVPRDVECYVDSEGNTYDFGFGLNWSGVINDERVATYCVEPLTTVESITYTTAE